MEGTDSPLHFVSEALILTSKSAALLLPFLRPEFVSYWLVRESRWSARLEILCLQERKLQCLSWYARSTFPTWVLLVPLSAPIYRPFQKNSSVAVSRPVVGCGFLVSSTIPLATSGCYKYGSMERFFFTAGKPVACNITGTPRTGWVVIQMYRAGSSYASGSRSATRRLVDYGRTYVAWPKGRHRATIVWLHGLGDNGASWYHLLETLPLPNIKWICPTAATRPVALFGGFPCTAWFDVADPSQDGPDDADGLEASAAHIANLLSSEPADGIAFDVSIAVLPVKYTDSTGIDSSLPPIGAVKLGIGGFSMGAATALYSASCFAHGRYGNGGRYPIHLSAVVGLSGWLPCSRSLKTKVESSQEAARRAASLPLLLCHGTGDGVVPYKQGERSAETLRMSGFRNLRFEAYNGLEHYTIPEEMDAVCKWLTARLQLDGSRA